MTRKTEALLVAVLALFVANSRYYLTVALSHLCEIKHEAEKVAFARLYPDHVCGSSDEAEL